jgi:hypothetical protein
MSKELSTKLYKLDFKEIINNATNKEFWNKKWVIYKYDNLWVEFSLDTININSNKLVGRLELCGSKYLGNITTYIYIPLHEDNYNEIVLNQDLCGKVDYLFTQLGEWDIRASQIYKSLKDQENDLADKLREIAEDFLDNEGVSNKDIRDAYIDSYISNNEKNFTGNYMSAEKPKRYVEHRATFCYIMNYKAKAEYIVAQSNRDDCDWIFEEAEELKQQLENDELEEYIDNLESL